MFLPQPSLAGEDSGQRGELWNKISFLLQYLSVQKKEILILAAAHMLTSKLQGSLDLKCIPWAPGISVKGTVGSYQVSVSGSN